MAKGPIYRVDYRRRRNGKTNYKRRLDLLKSGKPRLVIRKTNRYIITQVVEYQPDGDQIVAMANSRELQERFKWKHSPKNLPAAYLTGLLCGLRSKNKKINEAIADFGLHPAIKNSLLYSALKGAIDGGMNIPHSKEIFPDESRVKGKHIAKDSKKKGIGKDFEDSKIAIEKDFLKEKKVKKKEDEAKKKKSKL